MEDTETTEQEAEFRIGRTSTAWAGESRITEIMEWRDLTEARRHGGAAETGNLRPEYGPVGTRPVSLPKAARRAR